MPGDNYVVNYDINVISQQAVTSINNFVAATKNLQQARNQFNQLNSQINAVNQRFATWSKKAPVIQINTSQAERKIDRLLGKLTQLETRMKSVGLVQAGVVGGTGGSAGTTIISGGSGKSGGTVRGGSSKSQRTQSGRAAANRAIRTGRGNVRYQALGQTLIDTGGVGVFDFVKGMGIAYGIAGLGTLVSNVVKDATEYNNLMQTTKNILGSHDKNKLTFDSRFKGMERIIRNVGIETKFTAPEVADASKFLAMAGFDIEAINKSIRPIADIALVGDNDLGSTADVVTNIMTGFGIEPSQVRRAADIMTMTFTKSNTTLMEIAESYKYAGSLLSRNGTSFEEATAAIGILGDAGIKGSQAGTTLRTMALNIAKPTKAQAEMWEQLGISRTDSNGKVRPLIELFQELNARDLTLGEFGKLFHKTAASGASALAAHVDKWNEVIEENFMSEGMSSRLAEAKKNTIQGLWYQLTSSFTEAGMQAFEDLEGPIKGVLNNMIAALKSPETIDLIKRFSLTIADLGKTLFKVSGTLINMYKRFEPIITMWLKLQLVLSLVLVPLRAVSALLNFGRYIGTGLAKIGQLTLRFNRLGQSMWGVVRANNALNASSGMGGAIGGRKHSLAVWGRYAKIQARPMLGGAGAMLGGVGGALLGSKLGEEGSVGSMIGSIAGAAGGMFLGTKLLPLLFSNPILGAATGILGGIIALVAKMNSETTKAIEIGNDWATNFKNLSLEKLSLNDAESMIIGNMRIYNSQLLTQNERLTTSIELYRKYWKAKNGEESVEEPDKAFVETASGEQLKMWLDSGRRLGMLRPMAKVLGDAGIGGKYTDSTFWMPSGVTNYETHKISWNGIDLSGGDAMKLDKTDAASILLASLAADPSNPSAVGLEKYLHSSLIFANNSNLARQYLQHAKNEFVVSPDQNLAYPTTNQLREYSWSQIQSVPGYANVWNPIAERMVQSWEPLVQAMEELEKATPDQERLAELRNQWLPIMFGESAGKLLGGFGTEGWKTNIENYLANPTSFSKDIRDSADLLQVSNGIIDVIFSTYRTLSDKYKPLLADFFAQNAWDGVKFNGLQVPGWGVLNEQGKIEAMGGSTTTTTPTTTTPTTPTNNNGYQNQYRSQSATPKQIIVKIENLMNVESVDMSDPNVAATVNNLKQQMAQALIEVVADFDANAANLV